MIIQESKDFFKTELDSYFSKHNIQTFPLTQNYLVNLLEKFINTKNLFPVDNKKTYLFDLYKEYIDHPSEAKKQDTLLYLAEYSLFVSGFLPGKILKQNLSISYYIGMGSNAYFNLSQLNQSKIFEDVSKNFIVYMNSISNLNKTFEGNLPLSLELWNEGKNKEALEEIIKSGFLPKF